MVRVVGAMKLDYSQSGRRVGIHRGLVWNSHITLESRQ
jgi:hypothetical protein